MNQALANIAAAGIHLPITMAAFTQLMQVHHVDESRGSHSRNTSGNLCDPTTSSDAVAQQIATMVDRVVVHVDVYI